jgi:NAD(P)-dependent dehydrogenase (short-subunit alcohol dehydrogenase family)
MYLNSLKNKNVIITGCNKGIGKATLKILQNMEQIFLLV